MLIRPLQESLQSGRRKETEPGSAGERQGHGQRRLCFLSTPQLYDFIDTYIAKRLHLFQAVQQPYHFPKVASVEGLSLIHI